MTAVNMIMVLFFLPIIVTTTVLIAVCFVLSLCFAAVKSKDQKEVPEFWRRIVYKWKHPSCDYILQKGDVK